MSENVLENVWSGIINDKYETYYQPLYNFTGCIKGLEALARLNDPDGFVSPLKFISALERKGMIHKLDLFIFESVCKFLKKCKENNVALVPVSVNLSRFDFETEDFIDKLEQVRANYCIDPELLYVEITDSLYLDDKDKAIKVVDKFHSYGFKVTLDNYDGDDCLLDSGKNIHYDLVKINLNTFKEDLLADDTKKINSVFKNVERLGVSIAAQSVENKEQEEYLKKTGCELVQGYYYAKPMPEKEVYNLLNENNSNELFIEKEQEYKKKFENLLEQVDIYYWEYIVNTKEIYPCSRSIKDFNLEAIIYNCPKSIIELNIINKDCEKEFIDIFKQIDEGSKHVEEVIYITDKKIPYAVRCDVEFNKLGKPIKAYCSATRIVKIKES